MASATFAKSGQNIARSRERDTTKKHGGDLRVFLRVNHDICARARVTRARTQEKQDK